MKPLRSLFAVASAVVFATGLAAAQTQQSRPAAPSKPPTTAMPLQLNDFKRPELVSALLQENFSALPKQNDMPLFLYLMGLHAALSDPPSRSNQDAICTILAKPSFGASAMPGQASKLFKIYLEMATLNPSQKDLMTRMIDLGVNKKDGEADGMIMIVKYGCDHPSVRKIYNSAECAVRNLPDPANCPN